MRLRSGLPALVLLVLTAALAGCGSDEEEATDSAAPPASEAPSGARAQVCESPAALGGQIRVSGGPCAQGRRAVALWTDSERCSPPGASRSSCKVAGLTCLGARTDRGLAVSCARPGFSVAFVGRTG